MKKISKGEKGIGEPIERVGGGIRNLELNSGRTWGLCTKFKPFPAASSCLMFISSFSVGWLLVDVWLVGWFVGQLVHPFVHR